MDYSDPTMNGEPYSTETISRLSARTRVNGTNLKFTLLPVSWVEPEAESNLKIYRHKTRRATSSPSSPALLQCGGRAGEFWETCSYGLLWLCALATFYCCVC